MVKDIKGEEDASFYAGLLVSAFAMAEASTAMIWGHISDRYGRKPIILVALAGTALSSLIFGFAKRYWVALLARVIGGALNGNVAVMQTMVAEMIKNPKHERKFLPVKCVSVRLTLYSRGIRCPAFHVESGFDCWVSLGRVYSTTCSVLSPPILSGRHLR